jgi:hypothetical protein
MRTFVGDKPSRRGYDYVDLRYTNEPLGPPLATRVLDLALPPGLPKGSGASQSSKGAGKGATAGKMPPSKRSRPPPGGGAASSGASGARTKAGGTASGGASKSGVSQGSPGSPSDAPDTNDDSDSGLEEDEIYDLHRTLASEMPHSFEKPQWPTYRDTGLGAPVCTLPVAFNPLMTRPEVRYESPEAEKWQGDPGSKEFIEEHGVAIGISYRNMKNGTPWYMAIDFDLDVDLWVVWSLSVQQGRELLELSGLNMNRIKVKNHYFNRIALAALQHARYYDRPFLEVIDQAFDSEKPLLQAAGKASIERFRKAVEDAKINRSWTGRSSLR